MMYNQVIQELEALSIMPKTMPGLEKLKKALFQKDWFKKINPKKTITIAGTNGKGTTAAALEALLLSAEKNVGLFTSPHLISTTERIRINAKNITEDDFIALYLENKKLIFDFELTHFESLTLMAADYFYEKNNLDFVIFEVGLGGTYDATNVFPNHYSIITALGLDHQNILGHSILEIAKNKFGIIKDHSVVIHHRMPKEVESLFLQIRDQKKSTSLQAYDYQYEVEKGIDPVWVLKTHFGENQINIPGGRACENIMTALTAFEKLGFDPALHLKALSNIQWRGRMEKISWPGIFCPVYLSGDHNPQGVTSLIDLLQYYKWDKIHIVVGIGLDKDADQIFEQLEKLKNPYFYLTVTPFKGRRIKDYPSAIQKKAVIQSSDVKEVLSSIQAKSDDIVLITGSLYLVGEVLRLFRSNVAQNS